jgi:hypothetical protein
MPFLATLRVPIGGFVASAILNIAASVRAIPAEGDAQFDYNK